MTLQLETKSISKKFGPTLANDEVSLSFNEGRICAILGENGAGKTTLLNILAGIYRPDKGRILLNGEEIRVRSPKDALTRGIYLVQQTFSLVDNFTVAENLALLSGPSLRLLDLADVVKRAQSSSKELGIRVDPKSLIWKLPMNFRQLVEIQKGLTYGAQVLMLDEPTSVLGPQEAEDLGRILKTLAGSGKIVIITSHKVEQVLSITDDIVVMRHGKVTFVGTTEQTRHAKDVIQHMFGEEFNVKSLEKKNVESTLVLEVSNLRLKDTKHEVVLDGVNLKLQKGRITGVAGVAGNGQKELAETIVGLLKPSDGTISLNGKLLGGLVAGSIRRMKVGYIPEDGLTSGSVPDFSLSENLSLTTYDLDNTSLLIDKKTRDENAERAIEEYGITPPNKNLAAKYLSGGNMQKLIDGRELSRELILLVCHNPTKGLDIKTIGLVHKTLIEKRNNGTAILLVSEDLDEIVALSDYVAVMYEGKIVAIKEVGNLNLQEIGKMMSGHFTSQQGDA